MKLLFCSANDSAEDGIQILAETIGNVLVDIDFCSFSNNSDEGLEITDYNSNANQSVDDGDLDGSLSFCFSSDHHNGFNLDEAGQGDIEMALLVGSANDSGDSGVEMKEADAGSNWCVVSGFSTDISDTEGVEIRETGSGGVHNTLANIVASYSDVSHGVQVSEADGYSGTNQVSHSDVHAFENGKDGFEIEVVGTADEHVEITGGASSHFYENSRAGLRVTAESGGVELQANSVVSDSSNLISLFVEVSSGNERIEAFISNSEIYNTALDHITWSPGVANINHCSVSGNQSAYSYFSLFPNPDRIFENGEPTNSFTNWNISQLALEVMGLWEE